MEEVKRLLGQLFDLEVAIGHHHREEVGAAARDRVEYRSAGEIGWLLAAAILFCNYNTWIKGTQCLTRD
jgi:hypothetical protein